MKTYDIALEYSKHYPTELFEFRDEYSKSQTIHTGAFLNGEREGVFTFYRNNNVSQKDTYNSKISHGEHICFRGDGSLETHFFSRNNIMHGEHINGDITGADSEHYFVVNNIHIKELDYLINEPRDDAFYVTLALYGIDKEYTIGGCNA